jgi:hypothetical protein
VKLLKARQRNSERNLSTTVWLLGCCRRCKRKQHPAHLPLSAGPATLMI